MTQKQISQIKTSDEPVAYGEDCICTAFEHVKMYIV